MKEVLDVGLPPLGQPFSWAVRSKGMIFTAHAAVNADGTVSTGAVEEQARITFANLRRAMQAAGGGLEHVCQVLIYMTDMSDMKAIDGVYREFFEAPYPNRSSVAVSALAVPGMKIEIVAYAVL